MNKLKEQLNKAHSKIKAIIIHVLTNFQTFYRPNGVNFFNLRLVVLN